MKRLLWGVLWVAAGSGSVLAADAGVRVAPHGAPAPQRASRLVVETLVQDLDMPWSLAFLSETEVLITERGGRLLKVALKSGEKHNIEGLPTVFARGQGGLLDVALSPQFERDGWVYLSYAEADADGKAGTALGRGRLDGTQLRDWQVLFRQQPKLSEGLHFGSRIAFGADGHVFLTLGENNQRPSAQQLDRLQGKVVRLKPDGAIPDDNPFVNDPKARAEIWSYGHRNLQGAAINPWSGALWLSEHGPRGGDEINIPQPGKNYGWPLATYGINYSGRPIPEARGAAVAGTEPPVYFFERSPGLSGMAFYDAERFPAWKHSLFLGGLASADLIRLQLSGDSIVAEERLLDTGRARVRDVRIGPDGWVYVLNESSGTLLRLGLQD